MRSKLKDRLPSLADKQKGARVKKTLIGLPQAVLRSVTAGVWRLARGLLVFMLCLTAQLGFAQTTRPAPEANPGQTATLLPDGRWLLLGGESSNGMSSDALVLDPKTGQSTPVSGKLNHARAWHSATLLPDGTVFVFGGVGS